MNLLRLGVLVGLLACGADQAGGPEVLAHAVAPVAKVRLAHAGVEVDRELRLTTRGVLGTAHGPWVAFDGQPSPSVRLLEDGTVVALVPTTVTGPVQVTLTSAEGQQVVLSARL